MHRVFNVAGHHPGADSHEGRKPGVRVSVAGADLPAKKDVPEVVFPPKDLGSRKFSDIGASSFAELGRVKHSGGDKKVLEHPVGGRVDGAGSDKKAWSSIADLIAEVRSFLGSPIDKIEELSKSGLQRLAQDIADRCDFLEGSLLSPSKKPSWGEPWTLTVLKTAKELLPVSRPVNEAFVKLTSSFADIPKLRLYTPGELLFLDAYFPPQNAWDKIRESADEGRGAAQSMLGLMLELGYGGGVRRDYKSAAEYYQKAAGRGNRDAKYRLGCLYAEGKGVPKNCFDAACYFRGACEQGHEGAVAIMNGVEQNFPKYAETL